MSLKSKAELQLTKNKHTDLESDIEKLKRDKQEKSIQVSTQTEVLKSLQKEIRDQAAEISAKDKLIGDREKKIYQLKKKTQELEKFKFVLDYKIKELKRDIAPREMEITRLKKETHEMDKNLKHYNKINANLGYIVDDLRTRQENMQDLIRKNRSKIRANDIFIKGFTNAVYRTVQFIDDFDLLKRSVNENLYPYVKDQEIKNVEIDPDIKKEYEN
jgi:chromosome segregation ATPase